MRATENNFDLFFISFTSNVRACHLVTLYNMKAERFNIEQCAWPLKSQYRSPNELSPSKFVRGHCFKISSLSLSMTLREPVKKSHDCLSKTIKQWELTAYLTIDLSQTSPLKNSITDWKRTGETIYDGPKGQKKKSVDKNFEESCNHREKLNCNSFIHL